MTKDEALTLALEALEESQTNNDTMEFWDRKTKSITAIKEALAQPEQRPVAWEQFHEYLVERNFCPRCGKRTADLTVVHTCTPPVSQVADSVTGPKLLTDDAIEEIARKILSQGYKHRDMERRFARAIEQAYGIGAAQ